MEISFQFKLKEGKCNMKVLAEQGEGKMNCQVEYPSNHSRQRRKRNVDNLTFSNCGDTGFANQRLQIAPSSMKHSLDYLSRSNA